MSDKKNNQKAATKQSGKSAKVSVTQKTYPNLVWGVLAIVFVAFIPALSNGFVNWDDPKYILDNIYIKDLSAKGIKAMFSSFYGGNYHPLTALSNAIEFKLFGLNPRPYHFFNLVLHLINTLLVFKIIKLLCSDERIALLACLLFGIHPMHVESVAWISERKDVLYTLFYLIAIVQYLKYIDQKSMKQYLVVMAAFLASLLSKSAAVVLPLTLILIDYYKTKQFTIASIINKIPLFILSAIFGLVALKSQGADGAIGDLQPFFSLTDRIFLIFYSVLFYIFKLVLPTGLSTFHPYPFKTEGFFPIIYYASPLLLAILGFVVLKMKLFKSELIFGLLFFIANILLVIQVIPVGQAIVAERYSYVSYIGLFFIAGTLFFYAFDNFKNYSSILRTGGIIALILLATLTFMRNKVWQDGITLWNDVVEKYPKSEVAYYNLGNAYKNVQNFEQAIKAYSGAVEATPTYTMAYFNRAHAYGDIQKHAEAIADYAKVIQLKPESQEAYFNRAVSWAALKMYDSAIVDYTGSLKINPMRADAYYSRGNMKAFKNQFVEAMLDYDKAIEIDSKLGLAYNNRGNCKLNLNRMSEACEDWKIALQLGTSSSIDMIKQYCK